MKSIVSSTPGRICIAGEDIDWISGPSILCAINMRTEVKVTKASDNRRNNFRIISRGAMNIQSSIFINEIGFYKGHVFDFINASIKVLQDRGAEITPLDINISSQLPSCAGLSSSAAITVSTIKALSNFWNMNYESSYIAHLSYLVEKKELKRGVGQMDPYSCANGGILYLDSKTTPPSKIEKFDLNSDVRLVIVDTLTPRNTADGIKIKRSKLYRKEDGILRYINKAEQLISDIRCEFRKNQTDLTKIGSLITACHLTLRDDMKVSTPILDHCVSICLNNGAYGAKLTGAGLGGCMFSLISKDTIEQMKLAFVNMPVQLYVTTVSKEGVLVNDF